MNEILNQYQVKFYIRINIGKTLSTINTWLSAYVSDHYHLSDANRLLKNINGVLSGEYPLGGGESHGLSLANITISETKIYEDCEAFYANENIPPSFTLPTSDFKVIVEAWRDFLAQG